MAEYVDFHYMPLEGKITGKQVLKQTEDAINDLGQHVYEIDIDNELIQEAIDTSNQAIDTAEAALSAVTTNRAMWFNTVAEMKATDIALGITAATRGKGVFNDGDGAFYAVREIKGGDVDSDDTVFLDNGNVAERIKQFNLVAKGNNIVYVANVADLRTSDAVAGLVYGTTGYYAPNDGGAGLYSIRTATQTDIDNGGSILVLDNGNVAELITDETVNVKQFGAKGDGATDDTVKIQAAFDYLKTCGGGQIIFPFGKYKITDCVTADYGNIKVVGCEAEFLSYIEENDTPAMLFSGSAGSSTSVTADITELGNTFDVADASIFAPNDFVRIRTNELYFDAGTTKYKKGEIVQIDSITDNTITIKGRFAVNYTALNNNLTAEKLNLLENIHVDGLCFSGKYIDQYNQIGLRLEKVYNGNVDNCRFNSFTFGVSATSSVHCLVTNNFFYDNFSSVASAVSIANSSRDIVVADNLFDRNRHATTTSGVDGICVDITYQNNKATNGRVVADYSTHGNARYVNFVGNSSYNCYGGCDIRVPYTVVKNNTIVNCQTEGIATYERGCINIVVSGNYINNIVGFYSGINVKTSLSALTETNNFVIVKNNEICNVKNGNAIIVGPSAKAVLVDVSNNTGKFLGYGFINVGCGNRINVSNNTFETTQRPTDKGINIVSSTDSPSTNPHLNHNIVKCCGNEIVKAGIGVHIEGEIAVICDNIVLSSSTSIETTVTTLTTANNYETIPATP